METQNADEWVHDSPYGHLHLRDLFAAFALAGMLASGCHFDGIGDDEERAAQAYSFADAMIKQRSEGVG